MVVLLSSENAAPSLGRWLRTNPGSGCVFRCALRLARKITAPGKLLTAGFGVVGEKSEYWSFNDTGGLVNSKRSPPLITNAYSLSSHPGHTCRVTVGLRKISDGFGGATVRRASRNEAKALPLVPVSLPEPLSPES